MLRRMTTLRTLCASLFLLAALATSAPAQEEFGDPIGEDDAPIGGAMVGGEAAGEGDAAIGGAMVGGEAAGEDDAPIGGETLY
jgi:hypothetical protein